MIYLVILTVIGNKINSGPIAPDFYLFAYCIHKDIFSQVFVKS